MVDDSTPNHDHHISPSRRSLAAFLDDSGSESSFDSEPGEEGSRFKALDKCGPTCNYMLTTHAYIWHPPGEDLNRTDLGCSAANAHASKREDYQILAWRERLQEALDADGHTSMHCIDHVYEQILLHLPRRSHPLNSPTRTGQGRVMKTVALYERYV